MNKQLDLVTLDKKHLLAEFNDDWKDKMRRGTVSKMTAEEKKMVEMVITWITNHYFVVLTRYDKTTFNAICRSIMSDIQEFKCEHCTPERKCPEHGAALTSNDD